MSNRKPPVLENISRKSSSSEAGYTLKPGIRNLILVALVWALVTNFVYILNIDSWLLFEWLFGNPTGRAIWGTCSVVIPLSTIAFVKILEENE